MKRYITYIIAILSLAYVASCTKTDDIANPNDSGRMTLLLQSSIMTRSADDTEGLNEDVVSSVDCYFYPANSSADANAVWHCKVTPTPVSESSGSYKIENIDMKSGDIAKVFPNGSTTAKVYIIANYPGNDLPTAEANNLSTDYGSSIATLKAKIIEQTWGGENPSFVMDSDGAATVTKKGSAVSNGTTPISLTRAAAKIELTITSVKSEVKGADGCTYVPALGDTGGNIGITMHNAAIKSWIDNAWDADNSKLAYTSDSYKSFSGYAFTESQIVDGKQQYKQTVPFYSYPTHWGQGSTSGEAYLLLVVKWKKTKDENGNSVTNAPEQPCYYEIPIGKLDTQNNVVSEYIERNHHYQISIDVGTLGSFVQENPVTLSPLYMVVDWTSGEIAAQLTEKRYLVVDETDVKIYNKTEYYIPFASSHECEIISAECTQEFLAESNLNPTSGLIHNENADGTTNRQFSVKIIDGNKIVIKHGLNNDLYDSEGPNEGNGVFDFTPYTITFTIRHKLANGQTSTPFTQDVTITQYPAMYGTANVNYDYTNGGTSNGNNGYVWVNGYQGSPSSGVTNFGGAHGLSGSDDLNAVSMYTITITALQEGSKFVIGDPRTSDINNPTSWNGNTITWKSAPALYDGENNRTLKYYYPTDGNPSEGTSSHTYNMVAPKFRVCSAYGAIAREQTNRKYYDNVKGRCASYQEDGYPAGRWRLPTAAEFEIINTLTNKGLLPTLYVTTMDYWCAHGFGRYIKNDNKVSIIPGYSEWTSNRGTGGTSISVRCVYDEWYWGSEKVKSTNANTLTAFTWGDQPRNTTN